MTIHLDTMTYPIRVQFANGTSAYVTSCSSIGDIDSGSPDEYRLSFYGSKNPSPFNYWADGAIAEPSAALTESDRLLNIVAADSVSIIEDSFL